MRLVAGLLVASVALLGAASDCQSDSPAARAITINYDDGTHLFRTVGRFKYGERLDPTLKYASTCRFSIEKLYPGADGKWLTVERGGGGNFILIDKPADGRTLVRLRSKSCGKWH